MSSSRFLNHPDIVKVGRRPNGRTEMRVTRSIGLLTPKGLYTCPMGWRTDGGTFPFWAQYLGPVYLVAALATWFFFGWTIAGLVLLGAAVIAALWLITLPHDLLWAYAFHDWACQQKFLFPNKRDADWLLNEAMLALDVVWFHRLVIYGYVRLRSTRSQYDQPEFERLIKDNETIGWVAKSGNPA